MDWSTLHETRRSTRRFRDQGPPKEQIAALIQEARWAPSGGNRQPWRVTAVPPQRTRALLDRWQERLWTWVLPAYVGLLAQRRPAADAQAQQALWDFADEKVAQAGSVHGAPWLLLVHEQGQDSTRHYLEQTPAQRRTPDFESRIDRAVELTQEVGRASVAIFAEHLHLGAAARGWGSCLQWQWVMLQEELLEEGVLEPGGQLACGVLVGHAAHAPQPPERAPVQVRWI